MPIKVNSNNGNPIFSTSPLLTTVASDSTNEFLVDLKDVNKSGLNDNDVLVYDALTGKFVPIDKTIINDNDGGIF
tara:strand:+ start:820 stop:1044 length:225 start_codon:yes stop_codon:yes gene_type:complete